MMLSIITVNLNNVRGLSKTLRSITTQYCKKIEHIIIDGASTDGSVDIIREYAERSLYSVKWVSEKDKGIYNAMNKGIRMASGEYIQILNSGDCLAADDVVEKGLGLLERTMGVGVLLGNIIKVWEDGKILRNIPSSIKSEDCFITIHPTLLNFYRGTIPHDAAYIRRDLFDRYGYYDENMKICSDWKFFLFAMVLGLWKDVSNGRREFVEPLKDGEVLYTDLDMVLFDMSGVSNQNIEKWRLEKRPVLEANIPANVLKDYDLYYDDILIMKRLHKHSMYVFVRFMERVLFKMEKWRILES